METWPFQTEHLEDGPRILAYLLYSSRNPLKVTWLAGGEGGVVEMAENLHIQDSLSLSLKKNLPFQLSFFKNIKSRLIQIIISFKTPHLNPSTKAHVLHLPFRSSHNRLIKSFGLSCWTTGPFPGGGRLASMFRGQMESRGFKGIQPEKKPNFTRGGALC